MLYDPISRLLSGSQFVKVNYNLIHKYGIKTAVLIAELCNMYAYCYDENKLEEDGSFYYTVNTMEAKLGLSWYEQKKSIDQLVEDGVLTVLKKGLPAKNYYLIHGEILDQVIREDAEKARSQKIKEQELEKAKAEQIRSNSNYSLQKILNQCSEEFEVKHTRDSITEKTDKIDISKDISNRRDSPSFSKIPRNLSDTSSVLEDNDIQYIGDGVENDFTEKPKKKKRPGVRPVDPYTKMRDEVKSVITDRKVQEALFTYLDFRREASKDGTKLYTNMWPAMLKKLQGLSSDPNVQEQIVYTAIEHGWKTFYPPTAVVKSKFEPGTFTPPIHKTEEDIEREKQEYQELLEREARGEKVFY